jgi:surface antigen
MAPPAASAPATLASDCREYQSRVLIGGRPQTAYGFACRQSDGSWRVMPR